MDVDGRSERKLKRRSKSLQFTEKACLGERVTPKPVTGGHTVPLITGLLCEPGA